MLVGDLVQASKKSSKHRQLMGDAAAAAAAATAATAATAAVDGNGKKKCD